MDAIRKKSLTNKPKKSLGQNFLIDKNILQKAIIWANPKAGESVVEIGPGFGILTEALLNFGANVYAVECDQALCQILLRQLLPKWPNNLHLLHGDAVKLPRAGYDGTDYKVVANLPYAISTPWIEGILRGPLPKSMTILLQKETAQRFTTIQGPQMGAISVRLGSAFQIIYSHHVPPTCFSPKPKVDSMLIHLERRADMFLFNERTYALIRFLFNHRRKQLHGIIRRMDTCVEREILFKWLQTVGGQTLRAEQITIPQWQYLASIPAPLSPLLSG
ncbi:MAG: 16S rRNA (adenine(1518)-N(6)/adenine(1519)-N(6))-dimethyltransferase RsmA [Puniceicoccales bacterium]|jgi:16S rRNA (adenine1518-N6/adenine1519-N6)-dimethyltransferase|nr:16S rRNA (adenine(1518)-N(6)/adenine(1519)-N(6))-dimethyltransferase RsmA [Puniceicoccales bacterium]